MYDAVRGFVGRFGGSIIEQQDGRAMPREVMLKGQNLPSITE